MLNSSHFRFCIFLSKKSYFYLNAHSLVIAYTRLYPWNTSITPITFVFRFNLSLLLFSVYFDVSLTKEDLCKNNIIIVFQIVPSRLNKGLEKDTTEKGSSLNKIWRRLTRFRQFSFPFDLPRIFSSFFSENHKFSTTTLWTNGRLTDERGNFPFSQWKTEFEPKNKLKNSNRSDFQWKRESFWSIGRLRDGFRF